MSTNQEQPTPTRNDSRPIWDLVIQDVRVEVDRNWLESHFGYLCPFSPADLISEMRARDAVGRERYGTPLQAHNGRDCIRDLWEEAMDGAAYARQAVEEGILEHDSPIYGRALVQVAETYALMVDRRAGR